MHDTKWPLQKLHINLRITCANVPHGKIWLECGQLWNGTVGKRWYITRSIFHQPSFSFVDKRQYTSWSKILLTFTLPFFPIQFSAMSAAAQLLLWERHVVKRLLHKEWKWKFELTDIILVHMMYHCKETGLSERNHSKLYSQVKLRTQVKPKEQLYRISGFNSMPTKFQCHSCA